MQLGHTASLEDGPVRLINELDFTGGSGFSVTHPLNWLSFLFCLILLTLTLASLWLQCLIRYWNTSVCLLRCSLRHLGRELNSNRRPKHLISKQQQQKHGDSLELKGELEKNEKHFGITLPRIWHFWIPSWGILTPSREENTQGAQQRRHPHRLSSDSWVFFTGLSY